MRVVRFEDLEAWKEARSLVSQVYKMVRATKDLKRISKTHDCVTLSGAKGLKRAANGQILRFAQNDNRDKAYF